MFGRSKRRRAVALLAFAAATACASGVVLSAERRAPDPGGSDRARVPFPLSGPEYGAKFFGFHENDWEPSRNGWTTDDIARLARAAGANTHRFTIDWTYVERQRDVWEEGAWARYRRLYNSLVERDIEPLITVSTAPGWARDPGYPRICGNGRGCEYAPARSMLGEWREFVAEVARRFPRTAAIEIWNEPNLINFWKPTPDPERYAELVAVSYPAIKAVNPRIRVLTGGLAPAFTARGGLRARIPMDEFLIRAYEANPGLKGKVDGLSIHDSDSAIYNGRGSFTARVFEVFRDVKGIFNDRDAKLWVTEMGISTTGPEAASEERQALGLLNRTRRVLSMHDVEGVILHTLGDRLEFPEDDINHGFGVIANFDPLRVKDAYCEFAGRAGRSETSVGGCKRIDEGPPGCELLVEKLQRKLDSIPRRKRGPVAKRLRKVRQSCWATFYPLRLGDGKKKR